MSLICEVYYRMTGQERQLDEEVMATARQKIERYGELGVTIAEFGTRRSHSYAVHRLVVQALRAAGGGTLIGTSNVHMAMINQTNPIGTHAHVWFMFKSGRAAVLTPVTNVHIVCLSLHETKK